MTCYDATMASQTSHLNFEAAILNPEPAASTVDNDDTEK